MTAIPSTVEIVVAGGGPAGATAAADLARLGHDVLLVDGGDRVKPCGGAIPPLVLSEFDVPESLVAARIGGARIRAPSARRVDMDIDAGWVGMVDRETFDPWLRARAERSGATILRGRVRSVTREAVGQTVVVATDRDTLVDVRCRLLIGADGASSAVRRAAFGPSVRPPFVFAYHEIVESPEAGSGGFDPTRCEVHYDGAVSPDFYGWVFPHGPVTSVGVGSAVKGFDLRAATRLLRSRSGLDASSTRRAEGAPLPLRPLGRWDDRHGVILAGDAAGCVAPASGEGIYYAMLSGRLAAEAGSAFLVGGDVRELTRSRRRFMRRHGPVFLALGLLQRFWYRNDRRRERFARICADRDVQRLTWESYLRKRIVVGDPAAHLRVFFRDVGEMLRLAVR
jgi:geranylgeranyl reductase